MKNPVMITETTEGIQVSAVSFFQSRHSDPEAKHFIFSYLIQIENRSEYTVQLMRRKWLIFDSAGGYRVVEGEGVIGHQPVLAPGESYKYESACDLKSGIGFMQGFYTMQRMVDNQTLMVRIPRFELMVPFVKN